MICTEITWSKYIAYHISINSYKVLPITYIKVTMHKRSKAHLFRARTSTRSCSPHFPNTDPPWLHFYLHGANPVKTKTINFQVLGYCNHQGKLKKKTVDPHYIVAHPGANMKIWEAPRPRRAQSNEACSSSGPPSFPNLFSSPATKSEGVIPTTEWDLTDVTKLAARSSRASASAICSLGLWTGSQGDHC